VMDGWGVARELRARGIAVPIVAMTAAQDAGRWAREIDADAFLAKPFELDDLLTVISRFAQCPPPP
jgi:CheY-like chemotaxis protein